MATKIKGICKSFKFISQIFVVKEREMEIGYPTDVKHVAHVGWDGTSGTPPSWMNDFKTCPEFSSATVLNTKDFNSVANFSPWSSQDFDQPNGSEPVSMNSLGNIIPSSTISKKSKIRKKKSTNSTPIPFSSSSSSSSRSCLAIKSKQPAYCDLESTPKLQVHNML